MGIPTILRRGADSSGRAFVFQRKSSAKIKSADNGFVEIAPEDRPSGPAALSLSHGGKTRIRESLADGARKRIPARQITATRK